MFEGEAYFQKISVLNVKRTFIKAVLRVQSKALIYTQKTATK